MLLKVRHHRGQKKPYGSIPRIDWSHPLASKLLFYGYDTGAGLIIDLVAGRGMRSVGTAVPSSSSAFGSSKSYTASYSANFAADTAIRVAPPWTAATSYVILSTVTNNGASFGRTANNNASAPYINWGWQNGSSNTTRAFLSSGGTAAPIGPYFAATANVFTSVALVANSSSSATSFLNGVPTAAATTGLTIASSNTNDAICFNGLSSASVLNPLSPSSLIFYGGFWARALSAGELCLLHADPYCFLIYPEDEVFASLVGYTPPGLPFTITGISTAVTPVGPFKVAAGDHVGSAITAAITTNTNSLLQGPGSTTLAVAQTYTNGSGSIKIGSVTFNLDKVATPTGTLYAEITQTDATGSVLATSNTVAETSITATASPGEVVTFVFASPPTIAASATYGVVLRRTTGNLANYVRAYASSLGVYAGGIAYKHDGTSWSTVSANTDFVATVVPLITIASDAYYFFGRDGTSATTLQAFKSTAPDTSWASVTTKTGFTTAILNIAACQDGDVIHLAVLDGTSSSSVATKYLSFDTTTDTFLATTETVAAAAAITGQIIANWGVSLVVRSNGNAVIFYNGLQTNTSGTPRARLYYRERTGLNTYGTATRVDANIATDSFLPIAALGASDRIHFVFFDNNNGIQRHLTSANVLGTANSFAAARIILDVCRYDNAGVIKLVGLASGTTYRWDSADNPTITSATIALGDPARATDDGTDVWALYRSSADSDLYVKESTDNGATFGTAISTFVGTVAATDVSLSKNQLIYQRGSNVVIPYIVNDGGSTLKYNEYVVRTVTVGYTLTADTGTIALSGQTVVTRSLRNLPIPAQGVIAFGGQTVIPSVGMPATLGTIILSGQVNKLVYARRPVGGLGTLTLSGKDAALTPARKLPVALGTLTLAGQTAAMRSIRRLVADTGTLTLAGQATALRSVRTLTVTTGTLTLSGQLAGLRGARRLPIPDQGTITAAGYDILLTKSSTVLHYTMAAAYGTVALAGQTVNYKRSYVAAPAPTAQVALSGQTAALRSVRKLAVTVGTLTLAGQANALRYGHALTAGQGTLTLAGQATTLRYSRKLAVANGILTLSGQDVTLRNNNAVVAGLGILTLSGQSVTARFDRHAVVTSGTIELSGWAAALTASSAPSEMAAGLGTLTLSGQPVNFKRSTVFPVLTGTLTLSGQTVALRSTRITTAGLGTLTLSGQSAGLRYGRNAPATLGTLTLAGQTVALARKYVMPVTTGTITLFGPVINLISSVNPNKLLPAGVGVVRLAGQAVDFHLTRAMTAGQGTLTLTGQIANLRSTRTWSVDTGTLTINGQPAALLKAGHVVMAATTGTLALSGYDVDLQSAARAVSAETANVILMSQYAELRYAPAPPPFVRSPPPSRQDYSWYDRAPGLHKRWHRR